MRNNTAKKSGISLIVLIITITVALILVATVTITTTNAIDNANVTVFAKDLMEIQESTESYYITNNIMPSIEGSTVMTLTELLAISSDSTLFNEELSENGDLDSQFYVIDLAKINITKAAYGNKEHGENDIFVVSFPTMNAYYPNGIKAKGTTYFSITSKISTVTKVTPNPVDDSLTTVVTSGGIKVTKTNGWANKMGVNIDVNMAIGETLYMSVSGDTEKLITTVTGSNTFGFNLLSAIVANTETIKVPTLTLAEADYIEAGTKPLEQRFVDILKYNGVELVGKVRIDLSNFNKNLPTISSSTLSSYENMNTVKLNLSSSESGIREVRYEYLTKYTEDGTITNYYNGISNFDNTYMKNLSKKAKMENNSVVTINAPKNVQSIKVAVIDKAGNINLYNQEIAPKLYIGHTINSSDESSIQLTANMFSSNGIKTVKFSKSTDGITYTGEQSYTLDTTLNGVTTKQCTPYTDLGSNIVYIKIVAVNYNSTITETRVIKIDINTITPWLGVNVIATSNRTVNGLPATYNNPIIPKGFKAVNTSTTWPTGWNDGLVIEDSNGNQFVWIPVDGTDVKYEKWCIKNIQYTSTTDDNLPVGITNELAQITKYGGFYIARYEAGKVGTDLLVSKKSATTWTDIEYLTAKTKSEAMYNIADVKSGLVTGTQWDTIMKWIQNSGKSVVDSTTWGNHLNSISPANVTGFGIKQVTGFSEYWKEKNIYDIAGNTWEFVSELTSSNPIHRGGGFSRSGIDDPASSRFSNVASFTSSNLAFRVALYVM